MVKSYEILLILASTLSKEETDAAVQEVETDITRNQGRIADVQRIGRRRLEHPIRKNPEGYFVQINFQADTAYVEKLRARLRLKELILRFMVVDRSEGFVRFKSPEETQGRPGYQEAGRY